jgi:hypothetical protein
MSKPRLGACLGIKVYCKGIPQAREQPVCGPGGIRCKGGVSSSWAWVGNRRTCRLDTGNRSQVQISAFGWLPRGRTPSGEHRKGESTDARHGDGPTRSSDEGPVMGPERRGWTGQVNENANQSRNEQVKRPQLQGKSFEIPKRLIYEAWEKVQANRVVLFQKL